MISKGNFIFIFIFFAHTQEIYDKKKLLFMVVCFMEIDHLIGSEIDYFFIVRCLT